MPAGGESSSRWRVVGLHGGKRSDACHGMSSSLQAFLSWCCFGVVSTLTALIVLALEGLRGMKIGG
jgi:hypothetical protein